MENLPGDVLSEIFIRLRAKQIAQMRCISKYWNTHLSQSSFIKSHLDRSIHNNDKILFVFPTSDSLDVEQLTISPFIELPNFIELPFNAQFKCFRREVIGSVNGLICFKYGPSLDSGIIYIWNPSLSAVLTVPYSGSHRVGKYMQRHFFRFGYDPKTDDYKVFKCTEGVKYTGLGYDPIVGEKWILIEVYSMRKGSWKLINQKIPSHLKMTYHHYHICLDDLHPHLHWFGKNETGLVIVAFDLSTETFREIHLPVSIRHDGEISKCIGVLGGKVCVMSRVLDNACEMWEMGEYGVTESWVKHHVFPPLSFINSAYIIPQGFTLDSEFIFQVDNRGVGLYDPVAATTKFFRFRGETKWSCMVVEYVDSLVWVSPSK
ncbi:hypothetical protein LXL04_004274 [Taraxacum kok-saghyz]